MYRCESWTIKKAEHWRIDAFELWCWRSNQSILKEISLEYSLEEMMLKLKLQYFGHLIWRANSLEKTLMLGKIEAGGKGGTRGCDRWHHRLNGREFEQALGNRKVGGLQSIGSPESNTTDWTTATVFSINGIFRFSEIFFWSSAPPPFTL